MNAGQNDPIDIDSSEHEDAAETPIPLEPDTTEPETMEPETTAAPLSPDAEAPKAESKVRVFFRKLFRWSLGILIIFGIGFAVASLTIFKTERDKQELTSLELADARAQIVDLSAQISTLQSAVIESDAKLSEQLSEQENFALHVAILSARVDVANAHLALADDNAV